MAGKIEPHGTGWRVRWVHPDLKRRFSYPLEDPDEAKRFKRYLEACGDRVHRNDPALVDGSWDPLRETGSAVPTFGEYFDLRNKVRDADAKSKKQVRARVRTHFLDWWDIPINEITRAMLDAKIAEMKGAKKATHSNLNGYAYAPNTLFKRLSDVKAIFRAAEREKLIRVSPFVGDTMREIPEIKLGKITGATEQPRLRQDHELYIPEGQWQRLMTAADAIDKTGQLADMLWLMGESALRIGEVLALRVHSVIADPAFPHIKIDLARRLDENGKVEDRSPKANSKGQVPIPLELARHLDRVYVTDRPLGAALFRAPQRGDKGWTHNTWYRYRWQKLLRIAREKYGLDPSLLIYPHATRMTAITRLMELGLTPRDTQQVARHRRLETTEGYDRAKAGGWAERAREKQGLFTPDARKVAQ